MHACVRASVHACMRACKRACVCVCVRACMYACMRVCVCACVHVCAYSVYILSNLQPECLDLMYYCMQVQVHYTSSLWNGVCVCVCHYTE